MKKNVVIGIDFSKLTLDVTFLSLEHKKAQDYHQFANSVDGCLKMLKWVSQKNNDCKEWLFCGEYTGLYAMTVATVLNDHGLDLWLENPSQIKQSKGISREKTDKVDSLQIALYASRFMDRVKLYNPNNEALLKLRELVNHKDRLTKSKVLFTVPVKELKRVRGTWDEVAFIEGSTKELIKLIDQEIKEIERQMLLLLKSDAELKRLYQLINSIVGVGMQTAIYLLIHTWGFTSFSNPRQLACYCGIAPFSKQSGTSIKGKTQVSHIANKKLKTLLHMCALNAIRYDPVIKAYYERKTGEGKHRMNVINNVRNKLVHRIYAVVNTNSEYDKMYHLKYQKIAA
jgi:transposase